MISWRYHLISIVAVFLALSLGLLVGTTVIPDRLLDQLRANNESRQRTIDQLQQQVTALTQSVHDLRSASQLAQVLGNRLAGVRIVIVMQSGLDADVLSQARDALAHSGAEIVAVLEATPRMAASIGADQAELASILSMPAGTTPLELEARAAQVISVRLADGPPVRAGGTSPPDPLEQLLDANFLTIPPGTPDISTKTLPNVGGKGEVVVVLGGGTGDAVIPMEDFLLPVVNGLLQRSALVAAGESTSTEYPFVGPIRSEATHGSPPMVTVDDLDLPPGGFSLALGIERLLSLREGGDYGIKSDATAPVPPVS
jgi:Copper transport outer membrane protein, MctB